MVGHEASVIENIKVCTSVALVWNQCANTNLCFIYFFIMEKRPGSFEWRFH